MIDDSEYETIIYAKGSLLNDNKRNPWGKKEIKNQLDVLMGAFDGAEVLEFFDNYPQYYQ